MVLAAIGIGIVMWSEIEWQQQIQQSEESFCRAVLERGISPKDHPVSLTAWQEDRNITVYFMYDRSCGELDAVFIEIENSEGQNVSRFEYLPSEDDKYVFEGAGTSGEDRVKVTGVFWHAGNFTVMEMGV